MPIQRITLDYHQYHLLNVFQTLRHKPWSMLLHSGYSTHPQGRFDILVADPCATLYSDEKDVYLSQNGKEEIRVDDPFTCLHTLLAQQLSQHAQEPDLPFIGGAVGAWSYDLGRRYEKIPTIAAADIAFPHMAVGIYDWALIADHHKQQLTLISHHNAEQRLHWLLEQPPSPSIPCTLTTPWHANMDIAAYREKFATIQQHLRQGDCYQVNLTQRFQATYTGDLWSAFLPLLHANQAPFSAYLQLPHHTVLSLSPERFIALRDHQIETRPIKGTAPRHENPEQDQRSALTLQHCPKNRAENLMIVDLLRNDIGRVALAGSVQVPELFAVEQFRAVYHLVSTITATLPPHLHATDLLRACFPGGSITGAPKIRAMQIIETLEPQRRALYCGSIGYISCCGNMDTSIVIRSLIAEENRLYCWAGGGIVLDSDVQAEYQETLNKLSRILPLFAQTLTGEIAQ